VAQYYTFLRLGFEGYRRVQQACRDTARGLASEIAAMGPFELVSHGEGIPVFSFRMADEVEDYTVFDVSEGLRASGWQVPAYTMPPDLEDMAVLRIVVRNGFSYDLGRMLLRDLGRVSERLGRGAGAGGAEQRAAFHH
jgi:glutamate decarboxylase